MKRTKDFPARNRLFSLFAGPLLILTFVFAATGIVSAQSYTEGFDTVAAGSATPLPGWTAVNHSTTIGTVPYWFQGNPAVFTAQSGADSSYIGANYNNTTGTNTINNWLITPVRTLRNGDTFSFYTRTGDASAYPDRLELRMSLNGASANVGTTATDVGDFTTLLLSVNPTLAVGGYPETWTQYTATITGLAGPTSGRLAFRYFVTSGGPTGDNSDYIGIDTVSYTSNAVTAVVKSPVDYNGDGKTDWSVVRNTGGGSGGQITWYNCINGVAEPGCFSATQFGISTDFFLPADYDGDGKADIAVWRAAAAGSAAFYILQSGTNTVRTDDFGQTGDDPKVVADYTGDGKADPAVYRAGATAGAQSYWYYRASSGPYTGNIVYEQWGSNGDFPGPGDYDGDGKSDFMVQRNAGGGQANFFLRTNTTNTVSVYTFGTPTDVIVPGDYDGDGKTDIATIRGSGGQIQWFYRSSSTGNIVYLGAFGASATDYPVPGDYDGDGKSDMAIWRPNADPTQTFYYVQGTTSGFFTKEWGANGDYPVQNFNTH
jgi:FG-GAP-like repeat